MIAEATLSKYATVSMLTPHSSRIGDQRESIVGSIIRTILPSNFELCTGQAFDVRAGQDERNTGWSNQMDLLVVDGNFPLLRMEDGSVNAPIESVVLGIEVKSALTNRAIADGFKKSRSLTSLRRSLHKSALGALSENYKVKIEKTSDGGVHIDGAVENARRLQVALSPAFYIFAGKNQTAIEEQFMRWIRSSPPINYDNMPRLILAGRSYALLNEDQTEISGKRPVVLFGELACDGDAIELFVTHLLMVLAASSPVVSDARGRRFSVSAYLDALKIEPSSAWGDWRQ